jgi:hypothetical protein
VPCALLEARYSTKKIPLALLPKDATECLGNRAVKHIMDGYERDQQKELDAEEME